MPFRPNRLAAALILSPAILCATSQADTPALEEVLIIGARSAAGEAGSAHVLNAEHLARFAFADPDEGADSDD